MSEFLIPENHRQRPGERFNPYEESGARSIVRQFKDDVKAMLAEMMRNREEFEEGKTMLAHSPLARKVWVAASMKTLGLVEERPTRNGACALVLTQKALDQMENINRFW